MKSKFKLLLLLVFIFQCGNLRATHISGGDLTYKSLGGDLYEITLVLYRDCAGIPVQNPETINCVSSNGSSTSLQVSLVPGTGNEITFPCFGINTTCGGGNLPGFQRYEYKGTVQLPPSSNWNLNWQDCCRNCAITTTQGGCGNSFLIEANLNNLIAPNDNSPVFSNYPVAFLCLGENFTYNHGVLDLEGDSLVYTFITPRIDNGSPILFNPGYSATNFLTSSGPISLNPQTGDINMTPSAFEVGITAIRIDAYRNGVLIGNVMRDIQFQVQNCAPNVLPTATGINGTTNFDTLICAGTPICFDIFTNDLNAGQSLTVTWNNGVPGASFTTTPDSFPTATFCWTPAQADARTQPYSFTIMVKDDNCSYNAFQVYSYQIYVPFVPVDSLVEVPLCDTSQRGAIYLKKSGMGEPFSYQWYDGAVSDNKTGLLPGNYTVTVTNAIGCVATKSINITPAPALLEAAAIIADSASSPNASDGSLLGSASGGTPPYSFLWSNGSTSSLISGLLPGNYNLTVTDFNGCSSQLTIALSWPGVVASATHTDAACYGQKSGTVTITASGGTPPYSGTGTFYGFSAGTYAFTVTDAAGNSDQVQVIIGQPAAPLTVTLQVTQPACYGGSGTVIVSASGGTPPYVGTGTYSNLKPGSHTFMVSDANGCKGDAKTTIVQPKKLFASATATHINCQTGTGNINVTAAGGTAPYTGTGTFSGLSAGTYSYIVTDANGCTAKTSVSLSPNKSLTVFAKATPIPCFGGHSNVTVSASGGIQPYTGTGTFNLPAGTHTFTVTDKNGCTGSTTITVTEPPLLSVNVIADSTSGTLTAIPSGGVAPYSYLWIPGGKKTAKITVTPKVKYSVIITDANGCTAYGSGTVFKLMPSDVFQTYSQQDPGAERGTAHDYITQQFSFAYPNPFNKTTTIQFGTPPGLPENTSAHVEVYTLEGRLVTRLEYGIVGSKEINEIVWDASEETEGTFIYRLVVGPYSTTGRILHQKK